MVCRPWIRTKKSLRPKRGTEHYRQSIHSLIQDSIKPPPFPARIMATTRYFQTGFLFAALSVARLGAQTPSEESLAYANGTLAGHNGGSGWLGAWTVPGTATSPLINSGLAYPNLVTAGGAVVDTGGSTYSGTCQWFDPAVAFANGTTIWFSCLLRYNINHDSDILMLPFGSKGSSSSGIGVAINTKPTPSSATTGNNPYVFLRNGSNNLGIGGSTTNMGLVGTVGLGKPIFVVGRITLSATAHSDTLDVWVNQTQEPAGTPLIFARVARAYPSPRPKQMATSPSTPPKG